MADRVFFATTEDTGTPANNSGFNGFPYPFNRTISVPEFRYPVVRTLSDCVKLWWRIRNWGVVTDASATVGGTTTGVPNGAMTADPSSATRENDLQFTSAVHNFDNTVGASEFIRLAVANSIVQAGGGNLYPNLSVAATASPDGVNGIALRLFSPDPTLGAATGSIVGTVLGVPTPVYYWILGAPDSWVFTSFSLEPVLWWPYANSVGLPVWDTATGAQLRDPRG
jgi:hypothetical protein